MATYRPVEYHVDFDYKGKIYKKLRFNKGGFLVVTLEDGLNKWQYNVHFYYNGLKIRTMRYNKETFNKFVLEDAITRIYMERVAKQI